jgi:AcrR family transcriptional regulator
MGKTCKRDEIVRAAVEVIAEHGFHGAPMALIAERASVGAGTIYRYFENKDALIGFLYQDVTDRLHAFLRRNYSEADTFRERFLYLFRTLLKYFLDHPVDFRFLEQYFNSPYGVLLKREKLRGEKMEGNIFQEFFEEGIARKALKDVSPFILFGMTIGPINFMARDHVSGLVCLSEKEIIQAGEAGWDAIRKNPELS